MKIKMDECERLVKKLSKDIVGKIEENPRIHFYENRKARREEKEEAESIIIENALNTYAAGREKYEYPILICDASFAGDGTEGFVLTPDHIFYNLMFGAGGINVKDIQKVSAGTKFYNKGIYAELENSELEKICNSLKFEKDALKIFTRVLEDFVNYLKEKPESRSISYLAKEKHTVKCCYRCGYVFKEGNICPKCGSKFNE